MHQLNLNPDQKTLRGFGFAGVVAFGLLGFLVWKSGGLFGFKFGSATQPVAYTLWALGGICGFLSLVAPKANRPLYVLLTLVGYPIGLVVSTVLMALLFFGLITPIGLIGRLIGRDPLDRKWDSSATTYWHTRETPPATDRYFKQF